MKSKVKYNLIFAIIFVMLSPNFSSSFEATPQQIQEAEQYRQLYPPLLRSLLGAIQTGTGEIPTNMGSLSTDYSTEQMEDLKCFTDGHLSFVNNEPIETLARFLSDKGYSKQVFMQIAQDCNSSWLQDQVGQGFMLFGM